MENTKWKYVKPLKNEDSVSSFLLKQGIVIPHNLIHFLEVHNGGRPQESTFITASGREHVFKCLLSYNDDDVETIYKVYPGNFKSANLLPLGSDASGNFICYDYINEKYVVLLHETGKCESIFQV